jgi:hypothetical protein
MDSTPDFTGSLPNQGFYLRKETDDGGSSAAEESADEAAGRRRGQVMPFPL